MAKVRIITARAPGLIPVLAREVDRARKPVVLVPESFTLACETEIVSRSRDGGFFGLPVFSPSSLVREIRELTGHGKKKPVSADGQNMIVARLLHHERDKLQYYRDSAAQPSLSQKIAVQISDLTRARLSPAFLRSWEPSARRTRAKMEDLALIWDGYRKVMEKGFEDAAGQWISAVSNLGPSGLVRGAQLVICGFDYITHDILSLIGEALGEGGAEEVIVALICDGVGADRDIFRAADDSVKSLAEHLARRNIPYALERETACPPCDAGIAYVEKALYARGAPAPAENVLPDLSRVKMYYAKNSYLECQHACQTLIEWRREGIPWEDMAVAVCDTDTLPSLLPLTLSASGIPFNFKESRPILMSPYAQYFLSLLRVLRLNFCQRDVLRMIKTGFTSLSPDEVMDMENYALKNGIHRSRWLKPFYMPSGEKERAEAERMESLRLALIEPILELRKNLQRKDCTGKQAAALLFDFVSRSGVYDRLLLQEEEFALRGDDLGIDRNRQVWTAVNELLDTVASFIGDEPLPLRDLAAMLEASMASRTIKSLPQLSRAVMVAPPQMFFSSGVRCMIVMGLQENEISSGAGVFSDREREQLEDYISVSNAAWYRANPGPALTGAERRPYGRIGQSLAELAARQKQDVYQAVSLARERLALSCSGAKPSGGVLTPSSAFKKLARTLYKTVPGNYSGGLVNSDIRPFAPAFALEALALKLRGADAPEDSFLAGDSPEDALWRNALSSLYRSEVWHSRARGVLDALHVSPPTGGLSPEQAARLYASRGFTISRVETFASCPWRHLLQYGLDLFPAPGFVFEKSEKGTFNHDVLKMFLDEAMKTPGWPDLTEEEERRILDRALRIRARQWEGGVLRADIFHRYQGAGIIRAVRTSVGSMMRAFRVRPHFLPMAAEVPFGMPDAAGTLHLPPIRIRTGDGGEISFSGRIDRIDRLVLPDGRKYFMIVDNKMSSREVQQNSIVTGLQLQLPLYIRAARDGLKDCEPAGGLYQPVMDVISDKQEAPQIRAEIDKKLRTAGIILDDSAIQSAMAPVKVSKRLDSNDTLSAVTSEEMNAITEGAIAAVAAQVDRIRGGETAPSPIQDGMDPPCAWCDHADACLYDATLPLCGIRRLDHTRRMDLNTPK